MSEKQNDKIEELGHELEQAKGALAQRQIELEEERAKIVYLRILLEKRHPEN